MFELSHNPLSCHTRQIRSVILGIYSAPIVGTYFYHQGYKIPFLVCPLRHLTGIPCPTCGMTRSFMAIVRGDWSQALTEHLFGPIFFASLLIAAVHVAIELFTGRKLIAFYSQTISNRKALILSLVIIFSYHLLRLYHLSRTGELYSAFIQSPLSQMFLSGTNAF
jgi:hypothetical protein